MQRYAKMIKGQNKTERYCVIFYLLDGYQIFQGLSSLHKRMVNHYKTTCITTLKQGQIFVICPCLYFATNLL